MNQPKKTDIIASSQRGINQMAMYIYQAYRDSGLNEKQAKEKAAEKIKEVYNQYIQQAKVSNQIPQSSGTLLNELLNLIDQLHQQNPNSIPMRLIYNKTIDLKMKLNLKK